MWTFAERASSRMPPQKLVASVAHWDDVNIKAAAEGLVQQRTALLQLPPYLTPLHRYRILQGSDSPPPVHEATIPYAL